MLCDILNWFDVLGRNTHILNSLFNELHFENRIDKARFFSNLFTKICELCKSRLR